MGFVWILYIMNLKRISHIALKRKVYVFYVALIEINSTHHGKLNDEIVLKEIFQMSLHKSIDLRNQLRYK
jgi:hypothetical protein